jgi:hypothetical protein
VSPDSRGQNAVVDDDAAAGIIHQATCNVTGWRFAQNTRSQNVSIQTRNVSIQIRVMWLRIMYPALISATHLHGH